METHSRNLENGMKALTSDVSGLVIPDRFWNEATGVKNNLRHLSLKIKQFVVDGKAALTFAVAASRDKDIYAWMTGVNESLNTIKR